MAGLGRKILLIGTGVLLCGCASTPEIDEALLDIEVRPAENLPGAFDAGAIYDQAKMAVQTGDHDTAYKRYKILLLAAAPDDDARTEYMFGIANALAAKLHGEPAALRLMGQAVASLKADPAANAERVLALQTLHDIAAGTQDDPELALNAALEVNMSDHRLWHALGQYYDGQGAWLQALDTYLNAARLATKHGQPVAPIINNIGASYLMQGRYKEALDKFSQAVDLMPDNDAFKRNRVLGLILLEHDDANTSGLGARKLAELYHQAGEISAQHDKPAAARRFFQSAMNVSPVYMARSEAALSALSVSAN